MSEAIDESLVSLSKAIAADRGDNDAWSRFAVAIWPLVLFTVKRLGFNSDVHQAHSDVLEKLFKSKTFPVFNSESRARAYLKATVGSVVIDAKPRGPAIQNLAEAGDLAVNQAVHLDLLIFDEMLDVLTQQLPEQELVIMRCLASGMTREQIASKLMVTTSNLAVQIHRLQLTVREILRREFAGF